MERIESREKEFHETIVELNDTKKQMKKVFLGNAGIIVGVFLALIAALTVFADIKITSVIDFANLSMRYFIMLFASYQIYVNTADSGSRRGLASDVYIKVRESHDALKKKIINEGLQGLLPEYCKKAIERELINTRTVIVATIGMTYEELKPYLKRDVKDVKKDPALSRIQRRIIKKAMKVKPIKLTPEMIMQGGGNGKRSLLGINPRQKKVIVFSYKLFTTSVTMLFVVGLAFEIIANPTKETIMYTLVSIVPAVLNGFTGYKFGYENIVFDTVHFTEAQCTVMEDFIKETNDGREDKCANEARV